MQAKNSAFIKKFYLFSEAFWHLVFPESCTACGTELTQKEEHVCIACWDKIHFTYFEGYQEPSPLDKLFWGRVQLHATFALFYFSQVRTTQHLLHALKYQHKPNVGVFLGKEAAKRIQKMPSFSDLDALIPVPIHAKKAFIRGYNQSEMIAKGLSSVLNVPIAQHNVGKTKHTESQTKKNEFERWENVRSIFRVSGDLSAYKHVAIVDDVVTTGSTIEALVREMQTNYPTLRISIISLALARQL